MRILHACLIAALFAGTSGRTLPCAAREVPLVILHTTDLHGRLINQVPEPRSSPISGLARIATLIRQIRSEQPNVIYVDCGDTIQGTPESLATGGQLMISALEQLCCDAWVLGNHEFDWGWSVIENLLLRTRLDVLGANLEWRDRPDVARRIRSWVVREVDGVRIGIVGTTHPTTPRWIVPELLGPIRFRPPEDAIAGALVELRTLQVDVRVLAIHEGLRPGRDDPSPGAMALGARFPEFDVVLGAHTHEPVESLELPGGALYSQAGWHGQWLGRVDLVYDTVQRRTIRKSARLLAVTNGVPPDEELLRAAAPALSNAACALTTVLARVTSPLEVAPALPGDEPSARLIRAAIQEATHAEVVLHGPLSDVPAPAAAITRYDLWQLVPYENRIVLVRLTAGEIRQILEEILAQPPSRARVGVTGLAIELNPKAEPGARVGRVLDRDGRPPHPRRRFLTAMNSYMAASAGGRLRELARIIRQPEAVFQLTDIETRSALEQWLRSRRTIGPKDLPEPGYRTAVRAVP